MLDLDLSAEGDPALDVGNFVGHREELAVRAPERAGVLAARAAALEERFAALADGEATRADRAYAALTLARHVHLSTQFPERRPCTEAILRLCEERILGANTPVTTVPAGRSSPVTAAG